MSSAQAFFSSLLVIISLSVQPTGGVLSINPSSASNVFSAFELLFRNKSISSV